MIPKITINGVFAAYSISYPVQNDCGICLQPFSLMCPECKHPSECPPCTGQCEHSFHVHCIEQWVIKNRDCPMCRIKWKCIKRYSFDLNNK